jgi:carbamoyl-phosphate synthase large subunit
VGDRPLSWEDPAWHAAEQIPPTALVKQPSDQRIWALMAALRRGQTVDEVAATSLVDRFFIVKLANIVAMERRLLTERLTPDLLWEAKRLGFSDAQIAELADSLQDRVRELRQEHGIVPAYKMVDTCAAGALRDAGVSSILINNNPETVSTDFDASSRLYFEPLDSESVLDILDNEASDEGDRPTVAAQFGGQTAINLAEPLEKAGVHLRGGGGGRQPIDVAEDRRQFELLAAELGVPQPPGAGVTTVEDALHVASTIGYPVIVRPSYVLGGRAMEIVYNEEELLSTCGKPARCRSAARFSWTSTWRVARSR